MLWPSSSPPRDLSRHSWTWTMYDATWNSSSRPHNLVHIKRSIPSCTFDWIFWKSDIRVHTYYSSYLSRIAGSRLTRLIKFYLFLLQVDQAAGIRLRTLWKWSCSPWEKSISSPAYLSLIANPFSIWIFHTQAFTCPILDSTSVFISPIFAWLARYVLWTPRHLLRLLLY